MADTVTKDPRKQWDREVRDNARDLYLTGGSVTSIASELDVPVPTVRYWQNKDNRERRFTQYLKFKEELQNY